MAVGAALTYHVTPSWLRVADGGKGPLSEAELSRIWAAQSFPPEALTLADGRGLRVIHPGRPGGGAGPDYRDAIIALDGRESRGDVELHVRATSFLSHGHHRDAGYDGVVLHVVFEADDGAFTTLHCGRQIPVAQFAPWVGHRAGELHRWLSAPPLWEEPCSTAVGERGPVAVGEALATMGWSRFETRVERLRESAQQHGEEQALWLALLDTLGYGPDRAAWRRLAEVLPYRQLASLGGETTVLAALLAVAGLGPAPEEIDLPRPLSPPLRGASRPASRPERRLRALAVLADRAEGDLGGLARATVAEAATLRVLCGRWSVADPLDGPALLGEQRAREVLLNAVLPFAAITPELRERARSFAAQLPALPGYGKTAFLESALQRSDETFRAKSALEQQGLLALVGDWCKQGGCGRCPLS